MDIVDVTAFVTAFGALVAATAGLVREVRQWNAAKRKASADDD